MPALFDARRGAADVVKGRNDDGIGRSHLDKNDYAVLGGVLGIGIICFDRLAH